ncbi:MAG: hypothetical protein WC047_03805 [Kiritimatiellales bacterium]
MEAFKSMLMPVLNEQISVPTWEILTLLTIVALCLLFRATRIGLLLTYIFTLHLTWSFVNLHLTPISLVTYLVLGGAVLVLGFFSLITDYY